MQNVSRFCDGRFYSVYLASSEYGRVCAVVYHHKLGSGYVDLSFEIADSCYDDYRKHMFFCEAFPGLLLRVPLCRCNRLSFSIFDFIVSDVRCYVESFTDTCASLQRCTSSFGPKACSGGLRAPPVQQCRTPLR